MSRLTLTPGMESRLDGAPGVDLDEEELDARAKFFISQGMSPREALARAEAEIDARKDAAAAREAGLAQARQQRQAAWDMAGTDQRPTDVMEAEADYERGLAAEMAGGYRQDGPILRPGTEAFAARDRMMAMEGAPFTRGRSEDPIDDDVALRQEYERRFGRPPRTQEEVDFARTLMVDDFQTAGGQRKRSQAPGRWGSQQQFESPRQMDDYSMSRPGAPSQEEADMYASDTPMVLSYKNGRAGPMIAATPPESGERYVDARGVEQTLTEGVSLPPGVANAAFGPARAARGDDYPNQAVRTGMRDQSMPKPGDGYIKRLVEGPSGPQWVWDLSDTKRAASQEKLARSQREADITRYRNDLGLTREEALALDFDDLRAQARDARDQASMDQKAEARRIQTENAQMNSGQLGLQMQQMDPGFDQVMLLDRMTGGRRGGATPFDVQAAGAEAMRQQMLNRAFQSPEERLRNLLAERQMENELRQTNPDLAGQQDIASGNYTTREAQTHFSNLAADHDTTGGGFSVEDEANLRDTLMDPPYNMDRRTAERKAFELAESRRWLGGEQPAGEPTEPPEAPPAPAAEEPRRKTAGRRKRTEPVTPPRFPPAAGRGGGRNSSTPAEIPDWLQMFLNSQGATGRQGRGR
jgi:hypothetical protein